MWLLALTLSRAEVRVSGPDACVDAEMVELELRASLGDEAVDELLLDVVVAGEVDAWVLHLGAVDGHRVLWDRELPITEGDCPFLAEVVARSFQAGLSSLPGWSLVRPPAPPHEASMQLFTVVADAPRVGVGASLWLTAARRYARWQVSLDAQQSGVQRIGPRGVQVAGLIVSTGPGLELPLPRGASLRWSSRLGVGPSASIGRGFSQDLAMIWPRLVHTTELGGGFGNGIGLFARLDVPVVRVDWLVDVEVADRFVEYREAPFGVGLVLQVAGKLRSGDGGRR